MSQQFGRIILPIMAETGDLQAALEQASSEYDDRLWSRYVMREQFTWQRYLNWWVARRWAMPRDVRKR